MIKKFPRIQKVKNLVEELVDSRQKGRQIEKEIERMFLKIMTKEGWYLLDDVESIKKSMFDITVTDADGLYGFVEDVLVHEKGEEYLWRLECHLRNDKVMNVLFDTQAYILNDAGKTIERLK